MNSLACLNESRREAVRQSQQLAGFDYVEFDATNKTLKAFCLGQLPKGQLTPDQFRITGGRRVRDIKVTKVFPQRLENPELDDFIELVVDKLGDYSTYTLHALSKSNDSLERPRWIPNPDFDPKYNQIDFQFTVDCPSDLDCAEDQTCPTPDRGKVAINYLAKDYASFRQLIFDRLAVVLPDWRNRFVPDMGVTLVELLAYAGDYLSYYQDAVATEAYLATARQRISVRRHARLVDYALHEGCNARALLVVGATGPLTLEPGKVRFITRPDADLPVELTTDTVAKLQPGSYVVFEVVDNTELHANHDTISIYTWGDSQCCLPKGATAATLLDAWIGEAAENVRRLQLQAGSLLIFEEMTGPKTGNPADRDLSHRWAVRLTRTERTIDILNGAPVVNIEWSKEDALPFPLCLSSIGPAPECKLLADVSVAHGNVVLVDHGQTIAEDLPPVETIKSAPLCEGEAAPGEVSVTPARYRPRLSQPAITCRQAISPGSPASNLFRQDAHAALPQISLSNQWTATADLMESLPTSRSFVVEVDNDRISWLRFGDGVHGAQPPAGPGLQAQYRVGNGKAGNVGAESIAHVVWDAKVDGAIVSVRNPLAARGGVEPQSLEEAKLFAPGAFRREIQRAITAEDYSTIAQREFPLEVQRASTQLRWNGSWYEALVAIDAFGQQEAPCDLLERIEHRLRHFRRLGHDLRVEAAIRVPILISLHVCVKSVSLRAHVRAELIARFAKFFSPDQLTFGSGVHLSRIISLAQSVQGVEAVTATRFQRLFDPASTGLDSGILAFGPLEIAVCDGDPSFPENGRIEFELGGGR